MNILLSVLQVLMAFLLRIIIFVYKSFDDAVVVSLSEPPNVENVKADQAPKSMPSRRSTYNGQRNGEGFEPESNKKKKKQSRRCPKKRSTNLENSIYEATTRATCRGRSRDEDIDRRRYANFQESSQGTRGTRHETQANCNPTGYARPVDTKTTNQDAPTGFWSSQYNPPNSSSPEPKIWVINPQKAYIWFHTVRHNVFNNGRNDLLLRSGGLPHEYAFLLELDWIHLEECTSWADGRHTIGQGLIDLSRQRKRGDKHLWGVTAMQASNDELEQFRDRWMAIIQRRFPCRPYSWVQDEEDRKTAGPFGSAFKSFASPKELEMIFAGLMGKDPALKVPETLQDILSPLIKLWEMETADDEWDKEPEAEKETTRQEGQSASDETREEADQGGSRHTKIAPEATWHENASSERNKAEEQHIDKDLASHSTTAHRKIPPLIEVASSPSESSTAASIPDKQNDDLKSIRQYRHLKQSQSESPPPNQTAETVSRLLEPVRHPDRSSGPARPKSTLPTDHADTSEPAEQPENDISFEQLAENLEVELEHESEDVDMEDCIISVGGPAQSVEVPVQIPEARHITDVHSFDYVVVQNIDEVMAIPSPSLPELEMDTAEMPMPTLPVDAMHIVDQKESFVWCSQQTVPTVHEPELVEEEMQDAEPIAGSALVSNSLTPHAFSSEEQLAFGSMHTDMTEALGDPYQVDPTLSTAPPIDPVLQHIPTIQVTSPVHEAMPFTGVSGRVSEEPVPSSSSTSSVRRNAWLPSPVEDVDASSSDPSAVAHDDPQSPQNSRSLLSRVSSTSAPSSVSHDESGPSRLPSDSKGKGKAVIHPEEAAVHWPNIVDESEGDTSEAETLPEYEAVADKENERPVTIKRPSAAAGLSFPTNESSEEHDESGVVIDSCSNDLVQNPIDAAAAEEWLRNTFPEVRLPEPPLVH